MTVRRGITLWGLALVLVLPGCSRTSENGGAEESAEGAAVPVRIGAVETRRFADVVSGSGQWRSGGDLLISASIAGNLESLDARVGDRVTAGQPLGMLVSRDSWAALQGAEMLRREARDASAIADADRAVALARRELLRVPVLAPGSGVVVRRSAEAGAQVAEGAELLALVPDRAVVFEAHVPAAGAARLRAGQAGTVTEANAKPRAVTVQRVLPMTGGADQSTLVWLSVSGSEKAPDLDRYGVAEIVVGTPHLAAAVPDTAVVEDDLTGSRRVAVVSASGRVAWTDVTVGALESGWRELAPARLPAGTRIVVEGQRGLPDSTRVTPRP
jgi:multidrug efflux pump subunit AcrA (membrane-fusion protein)